DHAARLQRGDLGSAVTELAKNGGAVLTGLRWGPGDPALDAAEAHRQVTHPRRALQSRITFDRGEEVHGRHLRIIERLLGREDRTCRDAGLLKARDGLRGGTLGTPRAHALEDRPVVIGARLIGRKARIAQPSSLITHERRPAPEESVADNVRQYVTIPR